jgi:hypothetical protein
MKPKTTPEKGEELATPESVAEESRMGVEAPSRETPYHRQTEDYGGGRIQARHGRVDGWLLLVYLVMFLWALYYGFSYWGGLGPGLDLGL